MKVIPTNYTFDKTAKTITCADFSAIEKIAIITNITAGEIIYQFNNALKGGALAGTVLTLDFDTTAMSDTDDLQIIIHADVVQSWNTPVQEDSQALVVASRPAKVDRIWFTKAISWWVDTSWGWIVGSIGTGMWVNQTWGNLVITAWTTARSEIIIRSTDSFLWGIRLRARTTLSQRVANNNFIVELVDVIGDGLAYTISSATSITVTFPASFWLSAQNVGQSMSIGLFSGTWTFISWRYPIASVAGNNATFTVSWFAAWTGTCSVFWWNFYRLTYDGTNAARANFDTWRNGYATGDTTATISTTASPGHLAIITGNDLVATFADQLVATSAAIKQTIRASRDENIPDDIPLRLQIRVLNGTTAPTATTWTLGMVSVTNYSPMSVNIQDVRPMGTGSALPVELMRGVATATQPVSWTVTATVLPPAPTTPYFLNSAATTNGALIITGTSGVFSIYATNEWASTAYIKLYNKATAPTVGTDIPEMIIPVPAAAAWIPWVANIPWGFIGYRFALWLGIAITRNAVFSDTTAIWAGEVKVKLSRTT